jgi:hypothetical protein
MGGCPPPITKPHSSGHLHHPPLVLLTAIVYCVYLVCCRLKGYMSADDLFHKTLEEPRTVFGDGYLELIGTHNTIHTQYTHSRATGECARGG